MGPGIARRSNEIAVRSPAWLTACGLLVAAGCATEPPSLAAPVPATAAEREVDLSEFEEYCETAPCRGPLTISLVRDDGSRYESFFILWPPILGEGPGGAVNLLPGDRIAITGDLVEGVLERVRLSPAGLQPIHGIEFRFWQETEMAHGSDMILRVESTFDTPLKFDLHMMALDTDAILYTSSCPVHPGRITYEHWPHAIFQLFVSDFRIVQGEDSSVCE